MSWRNRRSDSTVWFGGVKLGPSGPRDKGRRLTPEEIRALGYPVKEEAPTHPGENIAPAKPMADTGPARS